MAEGEKAPTQVRFRYPIEPLPIGHIHFVRFSQLGGEALMDVGIFDDQALIAMISGEPAPGGADDSVSAYVTARYGMSLNTLSLIRSNIEQLWEKMRASGVLKHISLEDAGATEKK